MLLLFTYGFLYVRINMLLILCNWKIVMILIHTWDLPEESDDKLDASMKTLANITLQRTIFKHHLMLGK